MSVVPLPTLHIKHLDDQHLGQCSRFIYDCWHQTYASDLPIEIVNERTPEYFRAYLETKKETCWLAFFGDKLVGLISVSSNCIEDLWVDRFYQRRKIASRLVQVAIDHFRDKGFHVAQTGCDNLNNKLMYFFKSTGWKNIASEPLYISPGMRIDASVYTLQIS